MQSILKFHPLIRSYYFGGQRLISWNKTLPSQGAAESWEVSAYGDFTSVTAGGEFDGQSLRDLMVSHPSWWPTPSLPLIKLLDVSSSLPIHVHPSDFQAQQMSGNDPGKAEAWVILEAGPTASVAIGFNRDYTSEEIAKMALNGNLLEALNRYPAVSGDVFLIPPRTPHSAHDVVLWEVQQPSDRSIFAEPHDIYGTPVSLITFEAWVNDFTRIVSPEGSSGHHLSSIWGSIPLFSGFGCAHFLTVGITGENPVVPLSYGILTCTAGRAMVKSPSSTSEELVKGTSILLPMGEEDYTIDYLSSNARLLHVRHPSTEDLEILAQLGRNFD